MDGRVWLATHEPNALTAFDADHPSEIAGSISTAASVNLGAPDREWLWTTQFDTGLLERRSHDGGVVSSVYVVDSPTGLVVGEDDVWVSAQHFTDPITRVAKKSLNPTATAWSEPRVVADTGDAIWLGDHLGFDNDTLIPPRSSRRRSLHDRPGSQRDPGPVCRRCDLGCRLPGGCHHDPRPSRENRGRHDHSARRAPDAVDNRGEPLCVCRVAPMSR